MCLREKNPWITFYGLLSTLWLLQWTMIKRLRIPLNCRCISMDLLAHRGEWFSLNHKRQELILMNWTWKPPPRPGDNGQPICCLLCVLEGEKGRRFLFAFCDYTAVGFSISYSISYSTILYFVGILYEDESMRCMCRVIIRTDELMKQGRKYIPSSVQSLLGSYRIPYFSSISR